MTKIRIAPNEVALCTPAFQNIAVLDGFINMIIIEIGEYRMDGLCKSFNFELGVVIGKREILESLLDYKQSILN